MNFASTPHPRDGDLFAIVICVLRVIGLTVFILTKLFTTRCGDFDDRSFIYVYCDPHVWCLRTASKYQMRKVFSWKEVDTNVHQSSRIILNDAYFY